MKICPRCGKKGTKGELCSECSRKVAFSGKDFKDISIKVCAYCPSFFTKNKWKEFIGLEDVARKVASKSTGLSPSKIKPIMPDVKPNPGVTYDFEIGVDVSNTEKYFLPAKIEFTVCKKCSKMGTKYFEGILQLRNPTEEVAQYVHEDIEKQRDKGTFVTNEESVRNGIDFYITSRSYLESLGKKLVNEFGGILKINYKLQTRKEGKDLYRVNVLFEVPEFRKGDVVAIDGRPVFITNVSKKISGIDLSTNKKGSFDYKNTKPEKMEVFETTVSKVYPEVEVLHPKTYQPVKVENTGNARMGKKVKVCILDERVFLV